MAVIAHMTISATINYEFCPCFHPVAIEQVPCDDGMLIAVGLDRYSINFHCHPAVGWRSMPCRSELSCMLVEGVAGGEREPMPLSGGMAFSAVVRGFGTGSREADCVL